MSHVPQTRKWAEPLFLKYGVDAVFSGHVHAYERNGGVAYGKPSASGPIYVTVGTCMRVRERERERERERWRTCLHVFVCVCVCMCVCVFTYVYNEHTSGVAYGKALRL